MVLEVSSMLNADGLDRIEIAIKMTGSEEFDAVKNF
jgi:hypothetical protein